MSTQILQPRGRAHLGDKGSETPGGKGTSQGHTVLRLGAPQLFLPWALPPSQGFLKKDAIITLLLRRGTRGWVTAAHASPLGPRGPVSQVCGQCPPWKLESADLGVVHTMDIDKDYTSGGFPPGVLLTGTPQLLKVQNPRS